MQTSDNSFKDKVKEVPFFCRFIFQSRCTPRISSAMNCLCNRFFRNYTKLANVGILVKNKIKDAKGFPPVGIEPQDSETFSDTFTPELTWQVSIEGYLTSLVLGYQLTIALRRFDDTVLSPLEVYFLLNLSCSSLRSNTKMPTFCDYWKTRMHGIHLFSSIGIHSLSLWWKGWMSRLCLFFL